MKKYSTPAYVDGTNGNTEFGSVEVYLASDVDTVLGEKRSQLDAAIRLQSADRARISELEKSLRELVRKIELFDNAVDKGVSRFDPAVIDAKRVLEN